VNATLIFLASDSPADITLVVTDTTSKTDSFAASVDLTGADYPAAAVRGRLRRGGQRLVRHARRRRDLE
jgi:hypothetical protein